MTDSPQWPIPPGGHRYGAVKVEIDDGVGMAYIHVSNSPVAETIERYKGRVMVDLDAEGNTVGVELCMAIDPRSSILPPQRRWRLNRRETWFTRRAVWRFLRR